MTDLEVIGLMSASFVAGGACVYAAMSATIDRMAGRMVRKWTPKPAGTERVMVLAKTVNDPPPNVATTITHKTGPAVFDYRTDSAPKTQDAYSFRLADPNGGHVSLTISARHLARFVGLEHISRTNWSGDRAVYGECLRVAQSRGWVRQRADGGAGVEWSDGLSSLGRRVARLQAEGIALPAPARE